MFPTYNINTISIPPIPMNMHILCLPQELQSIIISLIDTPSRWSLGQTSHIYAPLIVAQKTSWKLNDPSAGIPYRINLRKMKETMLVETISRQYTDLFKWLICNTCNNKSFGEYYTNFYSEKAAKTKSFDILKYIYELNPTFKYNPKILNSVVESGNIEMIEWMIERGFPGDDCTYGAAAGVSLELLQRLIFHKTKFVSNRCKDNRRFDLGDITASIDVDGHKVEFSVANCLLTAAEEGHLDTVKWLHQFMSTLDKNNVWIGWSVSNAVKNDHFEMIKWFR